MYLRSKNNKIVSKIPYNKRHNNDTILLLLKLKRTYNYKNVQCRNAANYK